MSGHNHPIPADADVREEVINPGASYIVQAPAGSGKTELLTQRFLRLLSEVERPEKVLAITFTRKATREMLDRILERLYEAQTNVPPKESHKRLAYELAQQVLEQDRAMGWKLLENPGQLQIHTIDGLCARLAARGDERGELLGELNVVDFPKALYLDAAQRCIERAARAPDGDASRQALEALLIRNRGNGKLVQELLAKELPRRDQWLGNLTAGHVSQADLLAWLQKLELEALHEQFGQATLNEFVSALTSLAPFADSPPQPDAFLLALERFRESGAVADELEMLWRAFKMFEVGKSVVCSPKTVNSKIYKGTNDARKAPVETLKTIVEDWKEDGQKSQAYTRFVKFPALDLAAGNRSLLKTMKTLLLEAYLELKEVFASRGVCDFQEIAAGALEALGNEWAPGEALLIEDRRLEHILIDEFQDTSQIQYELVHRLLAGWEPGDGRTLFLVGDPMQSIYGFRKADVRLFQDVMETGVIGPVQLLPRELTVNFRSRAEIIDTVNRECDGFFSAVSATGPGRVEYVPVAPFNGNGGTVTFQPFPKDSEAPSEEVEAEWIAEEVSRLLSDEDVRDIAILARKRKQFVPITAALKAKGVAFEAVDIEPLGQRPVILDLLTLTRALLHPGDRIAWLALFQMPWCALQPAELLTLAGDSNNADLLDRCFDSAVLSELPESTASRVSAAAATLRHAVNSGPLLPLSERLQACWVHLGGPRVARREEDLQDAETFISLMEKVQAESPDDFLVDLEQRLESLYAGSAPAPVQLMTVHKAKGLEFDAVFLPGLEAVGAGNNTDLFRQVDVVLPGGEGGALMAPQKSKADTEPSLYNYLGELMSEAQQHEVQRLLYVGMTRAKQQLFLSASLKFNAGRTRPSLKGTFLNLLQDRLYPILEKEEETSASAAAQNDKPELPQPLVQLAEAAPAWVPPASEEELVALGDAPPDRDRLALGEALHHWLELIHNQWGEQWQEDWFEHYTPALESSLLLAGARSGSLGALKDELVSMLKALLTSEDVLELLSPEGKLQSMAEAVYLVPVAGRLSQRIVDRLYQDADGAWHIVDYKTGQDSDQTREHWVKQLGDYGSLVREAESGEVKSTQILQAGSTQTIDLTGEVKI